MYRFGSLCGELLFNYFAIIGLGEWISSDRYLPQRWAGQDTNRHLFFGAGTDKP